MQIVNQHHLSISLYLFINFSKFIEFYVILLCSINISIKNKSLVAIVGRIGSGKSSLMQAILGEMLILKGKINIDGKIAYVSQLPWIQNMSLKDNILYGSDYDHTTYERTINACALENDIDNLPIKDETEIGEKGVNLSGGQKQRVNMARALYANKDIYLFDDPLSAVDANVGQHLFNAVISNNGILKEKTRILITHKLDVLPYVDSIIVIDKGRIINSGTYSQLKEEGVDFLEFIEKVEKKTDTNLTKENLSKRNLTLKKSGKNKDEVVGVNTGKIIKKDVILEGNVLISIYNKYFKAMKYYVIFIAVIFAASSAGTNLGAQLWLANYTTYGININKTNEFLAGYAGFSISAAVAQALATVVVAVGSYYASTNLHNKALNSLFTAPMEFFETIPAGRILNIFSQDINVIDEKIGTVFLYFIMMFFNSIVTLLGIFQIIPYFVIPVVVMLIFYLVIQELFVRTSRQIKRLQSSSSAPILTHILETAQGSIVIRAFEKQLQFKKKFHALVDENLVEYSAMVYSNRWLSIRLELIANLMTFCASFFSVMSAINNGLGSGQVGFIINSITSITQLFNFLIRMRSEMESNLVSVERIDAYMNLKKEKQQILESSIIPTNWPNSGNIEFINYSTKYREELELALSGISISIRSGEKIGIVGRTGSGKSSMLLGLFRIIEASEGSIKIDNIDIASIGINELRKHLTIIPQDSFLFKGTLRHNIDPINLYNDAEIWKAIESAHLKRVIDSHSEGLDFQLLESGSNLSTGERQLVCLARAILKHSKILILDEATASIDSETDKLLQATIRREFTDCTILTVAHRLDTILDYDKILVLDKGKIAEFDTPSNLLQQDSYFKKLYDHSKYSE